MIRLRKELLLITLLVLAACASHPTAKGHLSSEEVEALMEQGVVALFQASRSGSTIALDNGDAFTVDLPSTEKIDKYLKHRRKLGKPGAFEIE